MSKISVVMPVYNAEKYISESIDSVLKQSYSNFEFIIIDDGSTDNTLNIIQSYNDKRILLLQNNHDYIVSLNKGLQYAKGKYIARMDADDVMHIDRLRIQHAIMEEEPSITVCGTWMTHFGEDIQAGNIARSLNGLIEDPLLLFLRGNFIFHPTTCIRRDFLVKHNLAYQPYDHAEDYKLWSEIAKRNGTFYIESQPLLYYRISKDQVSFIKKEEQQKTSSLIKKGLIDFLIKNNATDYPLLSELEKIMTKGIDSELLQKDEVYSFFCNLFIRNKHKLSSFY
ncbi:glycosyltransferase [Bacteroidales bacterium OttesenSCG-928-M11]|nr:glycosyltransferase [Bacteroidales bacterium OttesenSCG-928-M11]